jgi:hypothetical protein
MHNRVNGAHMRLVVLLLIGARLFGGEDNWDALRADTAEAVAAFREVDADFKATLTDRQKQLLAESDKRAADVDKAMNKARLWCNSRPKYVFSGAFPVTCKLNEGDVKR